MGNELEGRLRWLLGRMETLPDFILSELSRILDYAKILEQAAWQKIWLVHHVVDTGDQEAFFLDTLLRYSLPVCRGLLRGFRRA